MPAFDEFTLSTTDGFGGFVVSNLYAQPSEVDTAVARATADGATVLKPAKKGFFGGYSAVLRQPSGVIVKIASDHKKDKGEPAAEPVPNEVGVLLGVAEPKASRAFYEAALGLTTDRDYGNKYIDFAITPGRFRLGLLERKALAKDAGVDAGAGASGVLLIHHVSTGADVDAVLAAAASAGGTITTPGAPMSSSGYSGQFTDPDGYPWKVATA